MPQLTQVRFYEQIAGAIRARIVSGELPQGDKLPNERDIAASYGVSRNVVREAIRTLAKDGLVVVRQGSGTYVADATSQALGDSLELALSVGGVKQNLADLVEIRQIIEPTVAGLAAERATPESIKALRREVESMEGAFDDVEAFIAADHRFHIAIADCTQNRLVSMMLFPIVDVLNEQRKRLFFVADSARTAQAFHHRILKAIEKGDAAGATEAMQGHVGQVKHDIARLQGELATQKIEPGHTPVGIPPKGGSQR
jgi:GntR family transcriptional repressor for pyruvate dehydrogenase complex